MKVRIVIPTYNRQEMLISLLQEILVESDNVQYVIVDDHSEDIDKLRKFICQKKEKYDLVLLESPKNYGGAKTRNIGLLYENAKAFDWVWFFDDDDFISKEHIREVFNFLSNNNCHDMVFLPSKNKSSSQVLYPNTINLSRQFSRKGHEVGTSCCLFSSSLIEKLEGWDPKLIAGQDTDLLLRAAVYSDATLVNTGAYVCINDDNHQRITTNPKKQMIAKAQFLKKNYKLLSASRVLYYLTTLLFFIPYLKRIIQ
ncbi:glycosyltransferase family 2 protein [Vibrio diabolicus]|uniref:glycosyltransferase family 2 protein n=1 Tax=Vibrio diabolicus TaxID=50719 RepID=UPI003751B3F9